MKRKALFIAFAFILFGCQNLFITPQQLITLNSVNITSHTTYYEYSLNADYSIPSEYYSADHSYQLVIVVRGNNGFYCHSILSEAPLSTQSGNITPVFQTTLGEAADFRLEIYDMSIGGRTVSYSNIF